MAQNQFANMVTPAPQATQPGQISVMLAAPTAPSVKPKGNYKAILYRFGITEVVLGSVIGLLWLATIIAAIAAPQRCYDYQGRSECYPQYISFYTWASTGAWCGIFLIPSGILGITAKKNPTICMYNANMAMSIISATMMGVLLVMSPMAAAGEEYVVVQVLHGLLTVVSMAALVVCIVHSAYCCAGVCCLNKPQYGAVGYSPSTMPQQYMQLPNGQLVVLQTQPMLPQNPPVMMAMPGQFQPHQQVPGANIPVTMEQRPNTGTLYPMNVSLGGNMPVTSIPSLPTGAQDRMQSFPSSPPSYQGANS